MPAPPAYEWWPNTALGGELPQVLPVPAHFEQACATVREDDVAEKIVCGSDLERFVAKVKEVAGMGFDRIVIHQAGPEQEKFFRFAREELLPALR